jgi:hypothetical protein
MKDPVVLFPSGRTFDKESISRWLLQNKKPSDPWTNKPLDRHMPYAPNLEIRKMLMENLGDKAYEPYDDSDFLLRYQALWDAHLAEVPLNFGAFHQGNDQFDSAESLFDIGLDYCSS